MPSVEWETPQDFFDTLDREFHFNIDVCASEENTKCYYYYTYHKNALYRKWEGSCWMNPPYDKNIGRWVGKAYESAQEGATVVCLLQGRSNDTKWWHAYVMKASEIRFIKDRLHFGLNGKFARANISSIVVIFKPYCQGPPATKSIDTKGIELSQRKSNQQALGF